MPTTRPSSWAKATCWDCSKLWRSALAERPLSKAVGGEIGLRLPPVDALQGAVDPHRHRPQHSTASRMARAFSLSPGPLAPANGLRTPCKEGVSSCR